MKPAVEPTKQHVVIYSVDWCPYCRAALSLLRQKNVEFELVDVDGDSETRSWLRQATGMTSVPQVFIGGKSYGGFTDIQALDRRGELDGLLSLGV